jgi:hypothetical protein
MVRMILAHPRSRSNLLGSVYSNYKNELFTPKQIATTQFYQDNKDLLAYGRGISSEFAAEYIKWLRQELKGQDFTFKIHYCDINGWLDAQTLIAEWKVQEIVSIERLDKKAAVLSLLLADKLGYASFQQKSDAPFDVTQEHFDFAYKRVVTDWREGLKVYMPDAYFSYENLDRALIERFFSGDEPVYQAWKAELKFKDQDSMHRLNNINNLSQVYWMWDKASGKV